MLLWLQAEARAPKDSPHLPQLQRWLSDANTELASLRKRLSEQVLYTILNVIIAGAILIGVGDKPATLALRIVQHVIACACMGQS